MMPEPTTVATKIAVPSASAKRRLERLKPVHVLALSWPELDRPSIRSYKTDNKHLVKEYFSIWGLPSKPTSHNCDRISRRRFSDREELSDSIIAGSTTGSVPIPTSAWRGMDGRTAWP